MLVPLALSLLLSATATSAATTCNGFSSLCSKSYGNMSFVGAHDSYAVGNPASNLAVNQDYDVTQQLTDGVRLLQMQAHNNSGTIQLCHTSCLLFNGGTLESYLTKVKSWMDSNPNDVVTLLIVVRVKYTSDIRVPHTVQNIDDLPASDYGTVFSAAGVDKLSYAPPTSPLTITQWPTLGQMIDNGTRLVSFLDNGADLTSVPYLLDEFTQNWETAYDLTSPSLFDCNVNRSKGDTTTSMFLINHFLDEVVLGEPAPDYTVANVTNGVSGTGSLGAQVDTCVGQYGRAPNFLLVDFYEYGGGSVFQVAASINGVTYSPTTPIATPVSASATSSSTGSTGGARSLTPFMTKSQALSSLLVVAGVLFGASSI
uniref:PLC-like phosphodiesterase n=1 Tax=Mycena chlorophos TaxID=658473 RepID=A0ABQ0LBC5_MYCCL|nr:PLC-like phosphodiesterase [Mycena chlorophos]